MNKRMAAGLLPLCAMLALVTLASAQNPCAEIGSDCRIMTASEVQAFKARVLAVQALLPVPDPARYAHNGAIEASTMPFVAATKIPGVPLTCRAFPTGSFLEYPYNSLLFGYDPKAKDEKPAGDPNDPLAATRAMMSAFENRVELGVSIYPHPFLVAVEDGKLVEVGDSDATDVEKSARFLSWTGNDGTNLHMIFGPRTGKEEETLTGEKPAPAFAPVVSIEVEITGPKDEVAALKKKIDRKAFEALLGPVVK
jgi:hypothetical protein